MYLGVSIFSSIFRMLLNNPFEGLIDITHIDINQISFLLFVYKFWPLIMHLLIFTLVGVLYKKNECPALGSFLYLVTFTINNSILCRLVELSNSAKASLLCFFSLYIVEIYVYHKIRNFILGNNEVNI